MGILNLDKPAGLSSARAVSYVKRLLPKGTRIGHAGTLDPFATGVLLLLVGRATKACEKLMDEAKQYEATIRFGGTTPTLDPESPVEPWRRADGGDLVPPSESVLRDALKQFEGRVAQRPPVFSALKVGGRRAYDLARRGAKVELAERWVRIDAVDLLDYAWPDCRVRIDCGRGTYVRAIARDLGERLQVGGYLTVLRRTAVGQFTAGDAVTLDQLRETGPEPYLQAVPPHLITLRPGENVAGPGDASADAL